MASEPITRTAAKPLPEEALAALDELEVQKIQAAIQRNPAASRESLAHLVQAVCETHGVQQTRCAIEAVIQATSPTAGAPSSMSNAPTAAAVHFSKLDRRLGNWMASAPVRWRRKFAAWRVERKHQRSAPRPPTPAQITGRAIGPGVGCTAALYFWGLTVLRFPFAMVLHHTGAFYATVIALG